MSKIQIKRLASNSTIDSSNVANTTLATGQPFFDQKNNSLYIGNGTAAISNLKPVVNGITMSYFQLENNDSELLIKPPIGVTIDAALTVPVTNGQLVNIGSDQVKISASHTEIENLTVTGNVEIENLTVTRNVNIGIGRDQVTISPSLTEIENLTVTGYTEIENLTVTGNVNIGSGQVKISASHTEIENLTVTGNVEIENLEISSSNIATGAVTTGKLASKAVTSQKLANNLAIVATKIDLGNCSIQPSSPLPAGHTFAELQAGASNNKWLYKDTGYEPIYGFSDKEIVNVGRLVKILDSRIQNDPDATGTSPNMVISSTVAGFSGQTAIYSETSPSINGIFTLYVYICGGSVECGSKIYYMWQKV